MCQPAYTCIGDTKNDTNMHYHVNEKYHGIYYHCETQVFFSIFKDTSFKPAVYINQYIYIYSMLKKDHVYVGFRHISIFKCIQYECVITSK